MIDWQMAETEINDRGWTMLSGLLKPDDADTLAGLYDRSDLFRSKVNMARHSFGRGEYQYFRYPLPLPIQALRNSLYPPLAAIANRWQARLGRDRYYPTNHAAYLKRCHDTGQRRPTPLLLRYGPGDYNCLHQDLYGDEVFPLQIAVLLGEPDADFTGGDFVLTEQRPRMQSRASVVPLRKGSGVIFPVNSRPQHGSRGDYQVKMRHGISEVLSGRRHTLGIIFHDAA